MPRLSKTALSAGAVFLIVVALGSGYAGVKLGRQYQLNSLCCLIPRRQNIPLTFKETLGLVRFPSQIGQDKWVSEAVFPNVTDGFFLDVGSGDGTIDSNTKILEEKGWKGICIDPFPKHMEGRTCQMFKEVVFNEAGKQVKFRASEGLGGIEDTLGRWKAYAEKSPTVELTTTTLGDILERGKAPRFIHFMSLDIEGAELAALRGFPFEKYKIGALAVEHNFEEKRSEIEALMESKGYTRVNQWYQDDFYVPTRR